jgi:hypothetical protein
MSYTYQHRTGPDRVVVMEGGSWVATFTIHCYTVTLTGPARTFSERFEQGGAGHVVSVTHSTWVRAAPGPVDEVIDERWLTAALAANEAAMPDALAIAMQYVKGAPAVVEGDLQIAGDASYGPMLPSGSRDEGSDFNDYLGLRWLYPTDAPDRPEIAQFRCLDCSGYMRMVWGYRHHLPGAGYPDTIPLSRRPRSHSTLPRRTFEIYAEGTGIIVVPDTGTQATDLGALDVGDLVFFDASDFDASDGDQRRLDHVGMYLGVDTAGARRFISSRKRPDGPTLADKGHRSVLDGTGYYAQALRAARRL